MALTFYGELGRGPSEKVRTGSRLYIVKAAKFITEKGRALITTAADVVVRVFNGRIIYGDTDSIYVELDIDLSDAGDSFIAGLLYHIVAEINNEYKKILTAEGISEEHQTVEMEVQGYYPRFYITEAKKKYVYYLAYDGNLWYRPWKFGYVGMDFKRRETVNFIRVLQKKVATMILDLKDIDEIVKFIYSYRHRLYRGKMDKHLVFSYNLTKKLEDYTSNTINVRAANKA